MALIVDDLTVTYGGRAIGEPGRTRPRVRALDGVSLTFEAGTIYGLFGRNGAGKSTLLAAMANRLVPHGGTVTLDGMPVRENERALDRLALMNDVTTFPARARLSDIMCQIERLYDGFDHEFARRMAADLHLDPRARFGDLSTGGRTAARLVAALCAPADYVLLDEPVHGLDAVNRDTLYRLLLDAYARRPRTIVVATHLIGEIAHLTERVVILDRGRVLEQGSLEDVAGTGMAVSGAAEPMSRFLDDHERDVTILDVERLGGLVRATVADRDHWLALHPQDVPAPITVQPLGLQDYFIHLTDSADRRGDGPTADGRSVPAGARSALSDGYSAANHSAADHSTLNGERR